MFNFIIYLFTVHSYGNILCINYFKKCHLSFSFPLLSAVSIVLYKLLMILQIHLRLFLCGGQGPRKKKCIKNFTKLHVLPAVRTSFRTIKESLTWKIIQNVTKSLGIVVLNEMTTRDLVITFNLAIPFRICSRKYTCEHIEKFQLGRRLFYTHNTF